MYQRDRESDPAGLNRDTGELYRRIRQRSFSALGMALLLAMLFVIPVSAGQGWMFRADEVHSGVYDDSGILPIAEVRWSTYTNGEVTSSPAVVDGVVYVGSSDNQVYAFNTADGTKIWSTYTNGAVTSSPAAVGGVVYVGSSDHQVYAFNATTGKIGRAHV